MKASLIAVFLSGMFLLGALLGGQLHGSELSDEEKTWIEQKEEVLMELHFYRYNHDHLIEGLTE